MEFQTTGQPGRFTFTGTAGQGWSMQATAGSTFTSNIALSVYRPNGNLFTSTTLSGNSDVKVSLGLLPETGTYAVVIAPNGVDSGTVSMRLVARQDPLTLFEQFRDFVLRVAPPGVRVEVTRLGAGRPSATPVDQPVVRAATRALRATFGQEPVFKRNGGSIPVAEMFERQLGLPVVLLGFTNPDDNAHSPNESMVLANYEIGIRTICLLWDILGREGID